MTSLELSSAPSVLDLYETMALIRGFEERLLSGFSAGEIRGTTHTSIGQEAIAAACLSQIGGDDIVVSNHRCHGHYIAYGGPIESLLLEIVGSPKGMCGGRGGSQHIHWRNFYSNGILGGTVPVATGMAFAIKLAKRPNIVVCFMGDGALGEGVV
jgi:TPP-dependent pyruvate/acetoin dehydrogenase alpha subunit